MSIRQLVYNKFLSHRTNAMDTFSNHIIVASMAFNIICGQTVVLFSSQMSPKIEKEKITYDNIALK